MKMAYLFTALIFCYQKNNSMGPHTVLTILKIPHTQHPVGQVLCNSNGTNNEKTIKVEQNKPTKNKKRCKYAACIWKAKRNQKSGHIQSKL